MINNRLINSNLVIAILAGVVAMVGINNISIFLHLSHGFYLAFITFIIMGVILELTAPENTKLIMLVFLAYAAIFVGVAVDASLDYFFRNFGRNLWGAEVVMWWIFAPIPVSLGILLIRKTAKRKKGDEKV
ncbi:MAG: hypothetical protein HZB31_11020 [Nitrospirae bacterium]|nr:hypothetical protein [Nitrospirota bacterium]